MGDLAAHADTAMYQAKAFGKNTGQVYLPELDMITSSSSNRLPTWQGDGQSLRSRVCEG